MITFVKHDKRQLRVLFYSQTEHFCISCPENLVLYDLTALLKDTSVVEKLRD